MTKCVLAMLASALLAGAGSVGAQPAPIPAAPVETVYSEGRREIEMVISRAGWHLMGRDPEGYRIGTGKTPGMSGASAPALQACNTSALHGHGAFERTIPAENYAGRRVRVTGRVKLTGKGLSTFYINIIGQGGVTLRHIDRENGGTGDWETITLVTDIRESAIAMDIGVTLWGGVSGIVWLDSVSVEPVSENVPTTGRVSYGGYERDLNDPVVSCDGIPDGVAQ